VVTISVGKRPLVRTERPCPSGVVTVVWVGETVWRLTAPVAVVIAARWLALS
jgi:hypothetical protein